MQKLLGLKINLYMSVYIGVVFTAIKTDIVQYPYNHVGLFVRTRLVIVELFYMVITIIILLFKSLMRV